MAETKAITTLALLESRLHHLEFLLSGTADAGGVPEAIAKPTKSDKTIVSKLKSLDDDLTRLTTSSTLVQDMLQLQARLPDLFGPSDTTVKSKSIDPGTEASIVLAHASTFPESASRLLSLRDLTIPPAEASAKLLELQPRINKVKEIQDYQVKQVAELRAVSARIVERWVSEGIVGSSEAWAELEARVRDVEKGTRKVAYRKQEENA